ncbi:MAG: 16S rRNA (adenine(1518)-N(6)/adenine(1519)-N(6))-dimethyltransferase RsmA [bacterium]|jgi:16S rRNA (adenine1518-N6/adenine1519-N6)-dimethyltransferase|nr:16S rRNA (adenine(1518)-N(6)/adenine(1519)-N(6))-dimethyltransferase RsmA [candidate division KSB1 bacterium]MDH7561150.1 16S rRNA (adenine(1518)-N(6)/adenine(1519)-N(6))-dimethyltransferase RsmA [bacterium]
MPVTGLRPKRSLGQHFLVDRNVAGKIVRAFAPQPTDTVVEIGPGQGALTELLAGEVRRLIAVELDRVLAAELAARLRGVAGVEVVEADFLTVDLAALAPPGGRVRLLGNIPYNISGPLIFRVLEQVGAVQDMMLMLQKEVARRVVARPGSKQYGPLAVHSQLVADVHFLFEVSPQVFRPRPKVDSAIVRWAFLASPRFQVEDRSFFVQFVRTAFGQRRKVLRNALARTCDKALLDALHEPLFARRAEQLTLAELVQLSNRLARCLQGKYSGLSQDRGDRPAQP